MTLKIKITHDQPGYDKNAEVLLVNELQPGTKPVPRVILEPEQSCELYVYDTQSILIREVSGVKK